MQFQLLCEQDAIEDAYVMGHRLIAFLSVALPRHPAYHSASQQRAACEQNLTWIRAQMGQIAIRIDEDQLNKFITNDFDPVIPDDDDATSSDEDDEAETTPQQGTWERFAGWSFDLQHDVPGAVDTDESSQDIDEEQFAGLDRQLAAVAEADDDDPDPDLEDISLQEEDDEALVYERDAPVLASTNFLKKIAKEDVRYESDSEAADSWAQDGRSDTTCSESEVLSCDPARIAFREIMGRQQERNVSPPPPPPPPANSPEILDVGKGRSTGFSTHAAIRRLP